MEEREGEQRNGSGFYSPCSNSGEKTAMLSSQPRTHTSIQERNDVERGETLNNYTQLSLFTVEHVN